MVGKKSDNEKPDWIKMKSNEVEALVLEIAKSERSRPKIGLILRDKHGIPKVKLTGKKLSKILEDNKVNFLTDKEIIQKKVKTLENHISNNKHDYSAKKSLTKEIWVLNKA